MLGLRLSVPALGRTAWHHTFPCKFPKSGQKRPVQVFTSSAMRAGRGRRVYGTHQAFFGCVNPPDGATLASARQLGHAQVPNLEWRSILSKMSFVTCRDSSSDWISTSFNMYFNHFQFHNWKLEYRLHHSSSPSQIQRNLDSGPLKLNRTPRPVASSVFVVYPHCSLSQIYLPRAAKPSHEREMRLGLSRKSLALKQHPKRAKARCSQRFQPV